MFHKFRVVYKSSFSFIVKISKINIHKRRVKSKGISFICLHLAISIVFASDPRFNRYWNKINSTKKKLCIGMCLTCFSLNLVISGQNRKYSKHQIFVPFSLFYTKVSSRNFRHIEYYNYFFYIKEAVY